MLSNLRLCLRRGTARLPQLHTASKYLSTLLPNAHINAETYKDMYAESIGPNREKFWENNAKENLEWLTPFDQVVNDLNFGDDEFRVRWFDGGKTNASVNCLDRHLAKHGDRTAIFWEPDHPDQAARDLTYADLHQQVCKFANALRDLGVGKGDRVAICMPMIPEAPIAMLACARIGAVHSVIFGGFSATGIAGRIEDAQCKAVITADFGVRGGRVSKMKAMVDDALDTSITGVDTGCVDNVVVVKNTSPSIEAGASTAWTPGRDVWYHEAVEPAADECEPEPMDAEDPLFLLYTSGSTGKPKGVLHTTAGYLLQTNMTFKHVFDYQPGDVYWCTADVGWITGHSYVVYGPLSNGATNVMHEGTPNYPSPARIWEVCDKYKVTQCYTAPTAIRALMKEGDAYVKSTDRSSLRVLGSVGEPINPEAWRWFSEVVGDSRCPIVDTWWQTETGGMMMTPLPGATHTKPGSCCQPYFGVEPKLVGRDGEEIVGEGEGDLCIAASWPSQLRTLYGNHPRFIDAYFSADNAKGIYHTGDRARRDADGYIWMAGRVDDVLNVSGHRLGTAEIESALVSHPLVAEAAVVGTPHDIKGEAIYAYVSLMSDTDPSDMPPADELQKQLRQCVRTEIGPVASPDTLHVTDGLPKTVSGKIMRRILRKVAAGEQDDFGDTSTLLDQSVVQKLVEGRKNL